MRSKTFSNEDVALLRELFRSTLEAASAIYDAHVFRVFADGKWAEKPTKGMYDAVMVALSEFSEQFGALVERKSQVLEATQVLLEREGVSAITGRASTKKDLENRIALFRTLFRDVLAA